jgi:hypothetical protein
MCTNAKSPCSLLYPLRDEFVSLVILDRHCVASTESNTIHRASTKNPKSFNLAGCQDFFFVLLLQRAIGNTDR